MKRQFSIRLYELLKSYEYRHGHTFDIDDLRVKLSAQNYDRFPDFRRFVLDKAISEINELSDIIVSYAIEKKGKRFAKVSFTIKTKENISERIHTWVTIEDKLDGPRDGDPRL